MIRSGPWNGAFETTEDQFRSDRAKSAQLWRAERMELKRNEIGLFMRKIKSDLMNSPHYERKSFRPSTTE